jgi:hypothetical protein
MGLCHSASWLEDQQKNPFQSHPQPFSDSHHHGVDNPKAGYPNSSQSTSDLPAGFTYHGTPSFLGGVNCYSFHPFSYSYGTPIGFQPIFSLIHYAYPFLHLHTTYVDDTFYSRE